MYFENILLKWFKGKKKIMIRAAGIYNFTIF